MDADATSTPLPAWLEAGLAGHPHCIVTAPRRYSLRAIDIDQPALIVPLRGQKTFSQGEVALDIRPGRYLMLHRALRGTVQNVPEHGDYRAWCVPFPWRVIDLARDLLAAHVSPPAPGAGYSSGSVDALSSALQQVLAALARADDPCAWDHALLGVLLALHRAGDDQFRLAHDLSIAARIRLLVAGAPARAWSSADIEEHLHMSGATLRRRLADEGTSLRNVVRDARLHHGAALLQTTRRPLKAVAAACGYRSVPSFSRQFSARFGVEPHVLVAAPAD